MVYDRYMSHVNTIKTSQRISHRYASSHDESKGEDESPLWVMCVMSLMTDCTLGYSKEKAQIEVLSRKEMSIVYPVNLKAPLPSSPDVPIFVLYHFARKILINGIINHPILMKCIGLKLCSKSSIPILISVKNILCIFVSINIYNNCLLLGKMNL
jgi:hypothetical protein